jgi:hypothetical protein
MGDSESMHARTFNNQFAAKHVKVDNVRRNTIALQKKRKSKQLWREVKPSRHPLDMVFVSFS